MKIRKVACDNVFLIIIKNGRHSFKNIKWVHSVKSSWSFFEFYNVINQTLKVSAIFRKENSSSNYRKYF